MFRWAAAAFLIGYHPCAAFFEATLQPAARMILLREGQVPEHLSCVFGKEGTKSKVAVKLAVENRNLLDVVYRGEVLLDKKSVFGRAIGFSLSKPQFGVETFGAGVFTSKQDEATQQLYYAQFFITLDLNSRAATLEASTFDAAITLAGNCKSRLAAFHPVHWYLHTATKFRPQRTLRIGRRGVSKAPHRP
ncbi:MAG: hypothetical protein ACR652_15460 [Methylocystis sp.]|uniref:hypothetical protein n=1 Tax=Methylocystis sp. TaxID=1911079 RepID=UPI003DA1D6B5